ncbi:DUF254-domain-containing protein [Pseudovirgaria hyperparasitica]|uniref:Vacuolar fusion protein MON1 n=1 Tax=Pseudovirgaria hyperparasitica TaxID=470096 RepID=A0A6A6WF65_9PEZI|nr:DUF254-domain-containing protein [Pseudovirgaria hyperparasitica]KAF2760799.1 DUF254-domain-containing protein [Pseudovirgaria hyperparasitica]
MATEQTSDAAQEAHKSITSEDPNSPLPTDGTDDNDALQSTSEPVLDVSRENTPPPLPPRPRQRPDDIQHGSKTLAVPVRGARPHLQSKATTALSLQDVHTQSESRRNSYSAHVSRKRSIISLRKGRSRSGSEVDDVASIKSYAPTLGVGADVESILGEVLKNQETGLRSLSEHFALSQQQDVLFPADPEFEEAYLHEFDSLTDVESDNMNEDAVLQQWKLKLKHFMILSSAGKPIYSRHGDDRLISHYIGVIQTIISFYQDAEDGLRGFTANDTRFVILSKGPLNLVAISRLSESDSQLRSQLEALYMQILSTLTLPSMERMFSNRPSTDLRRPLEGTETLISALADGFTRGSPSTLLSALECLKLRKSHRQVINNTLLKTRSPNLLYGLIVASGKLVSVVRPKKHSLHPGDLHLIFNMLFEAGSVRAGGGETWVPLCLPGFNNTGYLYMYVSFLRAEDDKLEEISERPDISSEQDEVAIILISANKESFFELKQMRDDLVSQLAKNRSLSHINSAIKSGRPSCTDIVPGTPLRHFLYKSRGNVQFTMPSFAPHISSDLDRRRLISLYHDLSASIHAKPTTLKVHHNVGVHCISLAWATSFFELYCVAPGTTSRIALTQAANKIVEWVRREEERVFIIGGAVF